MKATLADIGAWVLVIAVVLLMWATLPIAVVLLLVALFAPIWHRCRAQRRVSWSISTQILEVQRYRPPVRSAAGRVVELGALERVTEPTWHIEGRTTDDVLRALAQVAR